MIRSTIWPFKGKIVPSVVFLLFFGLISPPAQADTRVDLELVLAIDVSASVSMEEFNLQVVGLSSAFQDPEVIAAIGRAGPHGIAILVVQWSGMREQKLVIDWTHLMSAQSIAKFAANLAEMRRHFYFGYTRIDAAMLFSSLQFSNNGFSSSRQIIDLSGDGGFETKGKARLARDKLVNEGFVINGLAIETDVFHLARFFAENVIGGAGSFVVKAKDYQDFRQAIRRKLIREISPLQISGEMPDNPWQARYGTN